MCYALIKFKDKPIDLAHGTFSNLLSYMRSEYYGSEWQIRNNHIAIAQSKGWIG